MISILLFYNRKYDYHVLSRDGITYMSLTDRGTALRIVYVLLFLIFLDFLRKYCWFFQFYLSRQS